MAKILEDMNLKKNFRAVKAISNEMSNLNGIKKDKQ